MSDIPAEVLGDILSRLPVKSLLRSRCVSKPFCALIDSPEFIKLQLNYSTKTNSNLSIILSSEGNLYFIDFDSLEIAEKLDIPGGGGAQLVGSCNGLLLLLDGKEQFTLWNPSTRKYHKLPLISPIKFAEKSNIFGFGYDHFNDDYKAVRVVQFVLHGNGNDGSFYTEVYSLKSNSWRRVQDFPYYIRHTRLHGTFASGALHWVVEDRRNSDHASLIVAFDLGTEEYRLVPLPDFEYSDRVFNMIVSSLGGLLWVFCYSPLSSPRQRVDNTLRFEDTWVMKEYGVKESWTKLISAAQPKSFEYGKPLAYSKCGGQLLLHEFQRFLWYDIETKAVKDVPIEGTPEIYLTNICFGSLVQLGGEDDSGGGGSGSGSGSGGGGGGGGGSDGSDEKNQHKREIEVIEEAKDQRVI